MTNIVSRLSVHQEHELLLKLESAGLNDQLAQLVIDSKKNKLAKQLVEFLSSGNFPSTTEETQSVSVTPLLEFLKEADVAGSEKFIAADHFKTGNDAGVKFWGFGSNFTENFLAKAEENVPSAKLRLFKLKKSSVDKPIRDELGSDREETTLTYLWELLSKQSKGESGVLLTNGYANIFYIRGCDGTLWAVFASWDSVGGWFVGAVSVGSRNEWDAGLRVFSC